MLGCKRRASDGATVAESPTTLSGRSACGESDAPRPRDQASSAPAASRSPNRGSASAARAWNRASPSRPIAA